MTKVTLQPPTELGEDLKRTALLLDLSGYQTLSVSSSPMDSSSSNL